LKFTIDASGDLQKTEIVESSGRPALDELAARSLSKCRFRAGRDKEGNPMAGSFRIDYVWRFE
jgi:TonB family protein